MWISGGVVSEGTWAGPPCLKGPWILSFGGCLFMNNPISLCTVQKHFSIIGRWREGLRIFTCVKRSNLPVNRVRGESMPLLRNTPKTNKLCPQVVLILNNPPGVYFIKTNHKWGSDFEGCCATWGTICVTYILKFWKVHNCTETFSSLLWFLSIHRLFPYSF